MSEASTPQSVSEKSDESGSTIIGLISGLIALFFLYGAVQRLWWSLEFGMTDYLLLGLTYAIVGMIAVGVSIYGLSSRKGGAKFLSSGMMLISSIFWLAALYYWTRGMFLGGTEYDIFNALSFAFGGIILFVVGFISAKAFKKRGIISTEGEKQGEDVAERIEQRGDEIADNIEQFGDDLGENLVTRIPWPKVIGLGVILWLAIFPLVNYETALVVVMVTAWVSIPIAIYYDSKPLRQQVDGRTWWWVFLLGSLIPLFAIIPGVGWLLWKRRKI